MSVRTNIGKIMSAVTAGIRANASIDRGPMVTPSIRELNTIHADWQNQDIDNTQFIWGVHNWADPNYKVSK